MQLISVNLFINPMLEYIMLEYNRLENISFFLPSAFIISVNSSVTVPGAARNLLP